MSHRRERGSLAPFVGVALAALTVGSLVLFSVIAQRTSLEAFSARGVAVAPAPAQEATGSITLPAVPDADNDRDSEEVGADQTAEPDASELLFVTDEPVVATAPAEDEPSDSSEADAPVASDDADVAAAADADALSPFFSMAAGGADNGEVEATTDPKQAKGRDGDKKAANDKKDKKSKKDKKAKKSKDSRRSGSRGRSARPDRNRSSRSASAASRRPSKPAASSRSARPAQASRSAAPKARPSSNHQNQRGNGHSKGRGKGHRH